MSGRTIDLNADLGEGMPGDAEILAVVTSANIACGWHAGDDITMAASVHAAVRLGVAIGAHPGLPDRANFGRVEMPLSAVEIADAVAAQIDALNAICRAEGGTLRHVKPHGALYWMLEKDDDQALAVLAAIRSAGTDLAVYCLADGNVAQLAASMGMVAVHEVFADRGYLRTGALVPRSQPGAMIDDPSAAVSRLAVWLRSGLMETVDSEPIALQADTVCVHGDEPHALQTATLLREALVAEGWELRAPGDGQKQP